MLRSHLYEVMPETTDQFCAMPSIVIELEQDRFFTLLTRIRKKTKPLLVRTHLTSDLEYIEDLINRFKSICNSFQHADIRAFVKLQYVIMKAVYTTEISSRPTIIHSLFTLDKCLTILNYADIGSIRKSREYMEILQNAAKTKMGLKILGK